MTVPAADEPVIVTMDDVRSAHMCSRGARDFCARYGLDWASFRSDGISSDVLEAIGDHMGLMAVAAARQRLQPRREPRNAGGA